MSKKKYTHFRGLGRELAMQFLFQFDLTKADFEAEALERFFEQTDLSEKFEDSKQTRKSKKYASQLAVGVINNLPEIDAVIGKFLDKDWSWERITPIDRSILRVATYEMLFAENVPPIVAINEAVELHKSFGPDESRGFINALLNSIKENLNRDPRTGKKN